VPTVLRIGLYRCFFYAGDREEPPLIHIERDVNVAKFWLDPVRLANVSEWEEWTGLRKPGRGY
jgi:hypothetical protein